MIRINGEHTASVKRLSLSGDRMTIQMEDDIEKAVSLYSHVKVIETESLEERAVYRATGNEAFLSIIQRMPRSDRLAVMLRGIARTDE